MKGVKGLGPTNGVVDKILKEIGLPPKDVPIELIESLGPKFEKKKKCPTTGKTMYPSEGGANDSKNHLLRTKKGNTSALRVYMCEHCSHWHISSSFHTKKLKEQDAAARSN